MNDKSSDQEIADFFMYHIKNPCVEPTTGLNIRYFYIKEAKKVIETFSDDTARAMLEEAVNRYST